MVTAATAPSHGRQLSDEKGPRQHRQSRCFRSNGKGTGQWRGRALVSVGRPAVERHERRFESESHQHEGGRKQYDYRRSAPELMAKFNQAQGPAEAVEQRRAVQHDRAGSAEKRKSFRAPSAARRDSFCAPTRM